MSAFREYFSQHISFREEQHLFYQTDMVRNTHFEDRYIRLRTTEGRLYSDEIVKELPDIHQAHPLAREWRIRKRSADRLADHLRKKNTSSILEVGCGNGWLIHYLRRSLKVPCCGMDVNETELIQAVNVSDDRNEMVFVYADILAPAVSGLRVDTIILASALQYFADAPALLHALLKLLTPGGEIHILDTPVYAQSAAVSAKERSSAYFEKQGAVLMQSFYYHHVWPGFQDFNYRILYDPNSWLNRLKRKVSDASPFPWIRITS